MNIQTNCNFLNLAKVFQNTDETNFFLVLYLKVKETIQKYGINFVKTFKMCQLGHYELKITKKYGGPHLYKKVR